MRRALLLILILIALFLALLITIVQPTFHILPPSRTLSNQPYLVSLPPIGEYPILSFQAGITPQGWANVFFFADPDRDGAYQPYYLLAENVVIIPDATGHQYALITSSKDGDSSAREGVLHVFPSLP